jgi:ABC-type amino acid transport substrate-binding protein
MMHGFHNPRYLLLSLLALAFATTAQARDLAEILDEGVLRHIGIPYANFVTGSGDGLDVELVQGFAAELGVRYEYVPSSWASVFADLTGRHARLRDGKAQLLDPAPVRGDLIANGLTVLAWREEVVAYSDPTFPSGVWLMARAEQPISPIRPTGSVDQDIIEVKSLMDGLSVLGKQSTCLDPDLYRLSETRAEIRLAPEHVKLNEMAPAILANAADTTLLDVPDALIALEKWPGQLKVIGPVSEDQFMGAGFRKESPALREAFNRYLAQIREDGTYNALVRKYYPSAMIHFPEFFEG